jgi:predicted  nucleic acid-binding Zn-ribbon protein
MNLKEFNEETASFHPDTRLYFRNPKENQNSIDLAQDYLDDLNDSIVELEDTLEEVEGQVARVKKSLIRLREIKISLIQQVNQINFNSGKIEVDSVSYRRETTPNGQENHAIMER